MATARIEYSRLGAEGVIRTLHATSVPAFAVSGTATVAGSRPVVPAGVHFAIVRAQVGNIIVWWGTDPTASQTAGKLIMETEEVAIAVTPGDKLSFIELA